MIFGAQVLEWTTEMDVIYLPVLGEISAWQLTFISVGLPGFLIAGLFLTIAEPKRTGRTLESQSVPSWSQIIAYIISKRSVYAAIILGNSSVDHCALWSAIMGANDAAKGL